MKTLFISAALCLFSLAAFSQQDGKDGVKKPLNVAVNPNAVHPKTAHPVKQPNFPSANTPAKDTKPAANTNSGTDKK
jgi:hypothetical protein